MKNNQVLWSSVDNSVNNVSKKPESISFFTKEIFFSRSDVRKMSWTYKKRLFQFFE